MLTSSLRDDYLVHIDDGLHGIQRICEGLGAFRSSVVKTLRIQDVLQPVDHNKQLLRSTFPKESFAECRFPAGTVLWFDDPNVGHVFKAQLADPTTMTNEFLFKDGSWESWYVNGRCRFFMRIFLAREGIEVPVSCVVHRA